MSGPALFDLAHPFFKPLWRRVVLVAVTAAWATVEFVTGAPFWGILFGAMAAYAAWSFFVAFKPRDEP